MTMEGIGNHEEKETGCIQNISEAGSCIRGKIIVPLNICIISMT